MPEHIKFGSTTLWTAGASPNVVFVSEQDLTGRVNVIEELGDARSNIYRGTKRTNRTYRATFILKKDAILDLDEVIAWWEESHSPELGLLVIERETPGGVFYLDAVAEAPRWGDRDNPVWIEVVQEYTAPTPMWYGAETSATDVFTGTVANPFVATNAGDTPTWLRFLIANEVTDPKIEIAADWEIEFDLTMAGGDALAIDCKTPASAWYTPVGGAAARAYGYRTVATSFRRALLQPGANTLVLTAGADNPELIDNPGFETAGAGPPTFLDWTETLTHGTVNDEGVDVNGGAHAARLDSTADALAHYIFQTFVVVPGEEYEFSFYTHGDGVNDGLYGVRDLTNGAWLIDRETEHTGVTGAVYEQVVETFTVPTDCVSLRVYLNGAGVNGASVYYDDVSLVNLGRCTAYWRPRYEALG